jgi:hypothetical protein
MSIAHFAIGVHASPTLNGGGPPPTPGAAIYLSVEPVAIDPLINTNTSINGLEVPESPCPISDEFRVDIHLRNATTLNAPQGVVGIFVQFDFTNILSLCKPTGFTNMVGLAGGVAPGEYTEYAIGGFFDKNSLPVDSANYDKATQYAVAVGIGDYYHNDSLPWNGNDGLVAQITFEITGQPLKALNQTDFYGQMPITYAEIASRNSTGSSYDGSDIIEYPFALVPGTLKIDDPAFIPGDVNHDEKVSLTDLVLLANAYGTTPSDTVGTGHHQWNPNADFNGDGKVGLDDLVILAKYYGLRNP